MPEEPDSTREADQLRAADVDREFVAERLRSALNEGRLSLSEYDERLGQAYAARTYGDLKGLLTDLPDATPLARSQVVPAGSNAAQQTDASVERGHRRRWVAGVWRSWLTVACILVAIWAVGGRGDFWPAVPLGIWGAILVATTINGLASGAPAAAARRRAEREARRRGEHDTQHTDGKTDDSSG
ncbi:MAG TPA: DUF1707 domain-containing protein [Micromonosporaceae bacterium]|nr:DUF1707 domain-containing protein [Micromonosporaceae bacterium]